jgi:SAM-dependent methyltransferase
MRRVTPHLMDAAAIQPFDRVLDIGCGCGDTLELAARAARQGQVVGIDLSTVMLECAQVAVDRERLDNVDLVCADAQTFAFDQGAFDVAISRLGVMSFDDPEAAFANIAGAIRPGGRLAFAAWGERGRNELFSVVTAALSIQSPDMQSGAGPFALADPERVRKLLSGAGWSQITTRPIEEPLLLGQSPDEAIALIAGFAESRFGGLTPDNREQGLRTLRDELLHHTSGDGIALGGYFWLTTAVL